jgi:hypothetical protein
MSEGCGRIIELDVTTDKKQPQTACETHLISGCQPIFTTQLRLDPTVTYGSRNMLKLLHQ